MAHLGWTMLEIQQNTWGAASKPEGTQLVCFNYRKMYTVKQHYKMWRKSARTSMLRTQPPPLQLPGMQSIPTVGVIHGGIYGLNVFPIRLDTRENTCKIKCRKGPLWWVNTWAWNYSLWYRQTVEGICLKVQEWRPGSYEWLKGIRAITQWDGVQAAKNFDTHVFLKVLGWNERVLR